ncbi:MAG: formate dehydrogenase accessory protein FdhE [Pseudomonadota bacterium]
MVDNLLDHINRLMERRPHCREALNVYGELVKLMNHVEPVVPQAMEVEDRLKGLKKDEGFPLFQRGDLPLDLKTSSELLASFLEYLGDSGREDREGLRKALKRMRQDADWARNSFKAMLNKDEKTLSKMAEQVDLDPRTLDFLTIAALRPTLYAFRDSLTEVMDKKEWDYGYCPLCGSQPSMAYLDQTGKRFLHCELCAEEWPYPRVKCPFCQNEDQKLLGYFHSDQEEGFRVDFCRKCQRYIKTVDKRVFEEAAPMELEYMATLHLDILASKQGFT